jgi:hypothetical protein
MVAVCFVFAERSDLSFIATEGGKQAALSTQANRFSFHVTVQFHSPVMRDKKKGSAPRHIPRVVAWRGEARRAAEEERA